MKPFCSIKELAGILDEEVYATCNALVACNVDCYFNGKKVDLTEYDCFRPMYSGESIFVRTGGPPEPGPHSIYISAEALPDSWKELIAEKKSSIDANEVVKSSPGRWPWGDYETDLLRKLAAAADRFWRLYDPADNTTAPTNQQVTDWLKQQGVADRTAEIMATIMRADGLPTGPRK